MASTSSIACLTSNDSATTTDGNATNATNATNTTDTITTTNTTSMTSVTNTTDTTTLLLLNLACVVASASASASTSLTYNGALVAVSTAPAVFAVIAWLPRRPLVSCLVLAAAIASAATRTIDDSTVWSWLDGLLTTCLAIASAVYATSTNACVWILEASAFACLVISEAVLRPSLPDTYDEVHALWVGLFFVFLGAIPGQLPDAKEMGMRASETSFARPLTSTPPASASATSATSTDL